MYIQLQAVLHFCLMFVWFSLLAYLTAVIDDLGLTSTQAGVLAGAVPLTYIPLALITGLVVDRVGSRTAIGVSLAVFGGAQVLRAVAGDFAAMLLSTLLVGVGATDITFGLPKLVADLFRRRRIGTASSVYLVGSYLGTAAVFGLGRPVFGPALGGWRNLFLASGVAALGYAVLWGVAAAWSARRGVAAEEAGGDGSTAFTLGSIREEVAAVVGHREILLLVVIGTMYLFVAHGLQGWIVTIFEVQGVAPAVAGTATSVFVAAQLAGTLLVPVLADRREGVVACGAVIGVGTVGTLAIAGGAWLPTVPVVLVGVGTGGLAPLVRALPVEIEAIGPGLTATAVGLVFAVGEVGGFLGPALVGLLRDVTGSFATGIALFAVAGAVVAGAGLAMDI
jgi:cyanate permease